MSWHANYSNARQKRRARRYCDGTPSLPFTADEVNYDRELQWSAQYKNNGTWYRLRKGVHFAFVYSYTGNAPEDDGDYVVAARVRGIPHTTPQYRAIYSELCASIIAWRLAKLNG